MKSISYNKALEKIANIERYTNLESKFNSFDRSLVLATLFSMDKEKTLDDILKSRKDRMTFSLKEVV